MAASTTDRTNTASYAVASLDIPVASGAIVYGGCWAAINSSGYSILAGNVASSRLYGLNSSRRADNSAGANGAIDATIQPIGANLRFAEFDAVSPAQSWVGTIVFLTDDHTVATSSSNSVKAGMVVKVLDTSTAGRVIVDLLTLV